jgi:hypothetical protein
MVETSDEKRQAGVSALGLLPRQVIFKSINYFNGNIFMFCIVVIQYMPRTCKMRVS